MHRPVEPVKIAGPLYFVGTKGLGSYLFVTAQGNILFNTGMPSSGPMIVASIRKLGFKPEDIKLIINGHAHSDHAGAFAYFRELTGAQVAIMREDAQAIEDGGKDDFHYGHDWQVMGFPTSNQNPVPVASSLCKSQRLSAQIGSFVRQRCRAGTSSGPRLCSQPDFSACEERVTNVQ